MGLSQNLEWHANNDANMKQQEFKKAGRFINFVVSDKPCKILARSLTLILFNLNAKFKYSS